MNSEGKEASFEIWRLVMGIYRNWYRNAEKELAKEDVSVMEYRILRQLSEIGPQPMVKLADENYITQGWVTSLVDRLESKKYVERIRSNIDRRVVNISATEEGIHFYKKIVDIHEEFIARTLEFMEEGTKSELKTILLQIENHLKKEGGPSEDPLESLRRNIE